MPTWRLHEPESAQATASLQWGDLAAGVKPSRPGQGIAIASLGDAPFAGAVLRVALSADRDDARDEPLGETYVRQDDLVATYEERAARPFRCQVYWRALAAGESQPAGLEVVVSTQTHLLDSHPSMSISTNLDAVELWRLSKLDPLEFKQIPLGRISLDCAEPIDLYREQGPACFLWRLAGGAWSYTEMLPPTDHDVSTLSRTTIGLQMTHRLFGRFLEKGVILRARARGFFLPRTRDAAVAADCYRTLLESQPPLTA